MEAFIDHPFQQEHYHYLLLDPLKSVSYVNALHVNKLTAACGQDAVVTVYRTDLAHSPQHCPLLVRLACPGEDIPQEIINASVAYARKENGQERRYVCGWLSSAEPISVVAETLVRRADQAGLAMGEKKVLPFYEPLRFELLRTEAGFNEFIWPVAQWRFVSVNGEIIRLEGAAGEKRWRPVWRAVRNQLEAGEIRRVLFAWRQVNGALPANALLLATNAWANTAKYGLLHSQDRLYLALNALTFAVNIAEHPHIQSLIRQAASQPTLRLTQLMTSVPDSVWQEIHGNTGGINDI